MTATDRWRLPFTKMHGAGNDYVFVDGIRHTIDVDRAPALARLVADRHGGVGSDGLIVFTAGAKAPCRMLMWNADGSRGAMCGNGLRCLAVLARRHGHVGRDDFTVETDAGPRHVVVLRDAEGEPTGARIAMGEVHVEAEPRRHHAGGRDWLAHAVDAGNPHLVVFVESALEQASLAELAGTLQRHPAHPDGVNVNMVVVTAPDRLSLRTFERGSGETRACGTGAVASAMAAFTTGRAVAHHLTVTMPGGSVEVEIDGNAATMAGPATTVFTGELWVPTEVMPR